MMRVMIVDDELLVRNNLRNIIDWERNGFIICGEATNGKAAIEAMEKLNPDIVILDVSMPLMDGVELSKYISDRFEKVKMIVLSSFDNFEYVRDTMKNGAVDYLLKHKLDAKALLSLLEKVRNGMQAESKQRDAMERITRGWNIASPAAQQNFIRDLVLGTNRYTDDLDKYLDTMQLQNFTGNIVVAVMQIVNFLIITEKYSDKDTSLFIKSVIELYQQSMSDFNYSIITYIGQGKFAILFSFSQRKSEALITNIIHSNLNKISETIWLYWGVNVVFGISQLCRDIKDVPVYYKQASRMPEGVFMNKTGNNFNRNGTSDGDNFIDLNITQEKDLLAAMASCDFDKAKSIIENIFKSLKVGNVNFNSAQMCINELVSIADKVARKEGISAYAESGAEAAWREKVSHCKKLDEIHSLILDYYYSIINNLKKNMHFGYSHNMFETINYINRHYCENISLNDTAEAVGLSPQYLSSLFKKETGIGFNDYLNNVRIEKAKALIDEGRNKVKDIYNIVGFNNYSYFFKVFKDTTGFTPLEYSKKSNKFK